MKEKLSNLPWRTFILSDTLGGYTDPLSSEDPDVQICEDFNGLAWRREHLNRININGREGIAPHLLRLIISFHDQKKDLIEGGDASFTGVFINHAERTGENVHGSPFVVAETDNNVRIVATPLEVLSSVRQKIISLQKLPNDGNELFDSGEQFRSQYTPSLLPRDHGVWGLEHMDTRDIPELQNGTPHVSYVDGFGNILTWKPDDRELRERILERAAKRDSAVGISINGGKLQEVIATTSLEAGKPGVLNVYPNRGNIDFVGKWADGFDVTDKVRLSAYILFGKPPEGLSPVSFHW
ncbi:MAG: hypothetical protein ABIA92_00190 [Patescibacteria group bacterium]